MDGTDENPDGRVAAVVQVSPATVNLVSGSTQQFSASVVDQNGNVVASSIAWSATGGAITTDGLYTAGDVAGNFTVIGLESQTSIADTANVSISTQSGTLQVTTVTTGSDLDADGYSVTIGGVGSYPIGINEQLTLPDLPAGDLSVSLGGVAANCSVSGQNPRTISIPANGTAQTTFSVTCTAIQTGALAVTTATTGSDLDANGYSVTISGAGSFPIGINDQRTITDLPPGDVSVSLGGVAGNCSVSGQNPRTVSIPANGTAQTTFSVTCTAVGGGGSGLRIVNNHYLELNGQPWQGRGMGNFWTIADLTVNYQEMIDVYAAKGTTLMRMTIVGPPVRHAQVDPATQILYPVRRTGPGTDVVGGLKFDCTQLDVAFYDRLEAVVSYAASRGVVIILVLWDEIPLEAATERWNRNPWNPNNNINNFGLPGSGDAVPQFYNLGNTSLLASQEAVVSEVLQRIRPYGNVILSISNEYTGGGAWHRHWHDFVQDFEANNPGPAIFTNELSWQSFNPSYTDLISPNSFTVGNAGDAWSSSPARPVVAHKTADKIERPSERDAARRAQWRFFMNGGHTSDDSHDGGDPPDQHNSANSQAGADMILLLANFVDALTDINAMVPNHVSNFLPAGPGDRVGRAWRGVEYAVFLPTGGTVSVDLSDASGTLQYEWLDPRNGSTQGPLTVQGGATRSFTSPYSEAALRIYP